MRKLLVLALTAALLAVAGGHAAARPERSIKVGDDYFVRKGSPPAITVAKGTRVTFRWRGAGMHNVHARKGPRTFRSDYKSRGAYSQVLNRSGTYVVYCDIHAPSMRVTIKVH
jgi:plastocyanin